MVKEFGIVTKALRPFGADLGQVRGLEQQGDQGQRGAFDFECGRGATCLGDGHG